MSLKEDRAYLKERKEAKSILEANALQIERDRRNQMYLDHEDEKLFHEAKLNEYYTDKAEVKRMLVTEAMMNIYKECFNHLTPRGVVICENLMNNYINDYGVDKLLKKMKFSESGLLVSIQEETEEFFKDITKDFNVDDLDSRTVDEKDIAEFWNNIDKNNGDIEDITTMIRMRVSGAEEDFVNKNQEDTAKINGVLKDTAQKIQDAKATNREDFADAVEESETRLAKNKIYQIQHESNRSIFDRMVRNLSEAALKRDELKKDFVLESGRLNMENIVESARCMYTLLEMVSTLQLEDVDAKYIEDSLKSI